MPTSPTSRPGPSDYVLGTDDQELVRLAFQHRVWSSCAHDLWRRAGLTAGQTVLDLGAGPGYAAADLACLLGARGRVLAVEPSAHFAAALRARTTPPGSAPIEVIEAEGDAPAVEPGSVDLAFARWVLCFVPDPASVLERIADSLRPGGRLVIQDYVHWRQLLLAPRSESFERMCDAAVVSVTASGGDFEIGARLPGLLRAAGLEVEWIEPILRVARPGQLEWDWAGTFFASYVPRLQAMGLLTAAQRAAFETDWADRTADPDALLLTPPMVGVCARRA